MARIEKCNHCKFGWNNPCGCNRPDKGDPFLIDFSCYEPMTDEEYCQIMMELNRLIRTNPEPTDLYFNEGISACREVIRQVKYNKTHEKGHIQ